MITSWNSGAEKLLGYSEHEAIGQNGRIFFVEKDLAIGSAEKERATALANGKSIDERFHRRKDGSEFWASGLMFPLYSADGQHIGFTKIMRDLTERKKAEQALINAKSFFKSIVETVSQPLLVLNADFTINTANRSFYQVFKFEKKEVKGKKIFEVGSGGLGSEKLKQLLEKHREENVPFEGVEIGYHSVRTGQRLMLVHIRTLYSIAQRKRMILLVIDDITERKALEQQRNDFIGIVSHELKTPVTSLKAFGQVLQLKLEESGDMASAAMLAKMDAQINKLTLLINDLLDATKIEGGQMQFHEEEFQFDQLVREIIEEVQRTTSQHEIILQQSVNTTVFADRERVGQVLTNFLTNAIKYSPKEKLINVKVQAEDTTLTCAVQDFGIGIAKDKLDKVFQRFFRLSVKSRNTFPGVGLGLYISSEIIKRQGGKIWVESDEGTGSVFYFTLPLQKV
jgi:PAS domain S-box-containing protein